MSPQAIALTLAFVFVIVMALILRFFNRVGQPTPTSDQKPGRAKMVAEMADPASAIQAPQSQVPASRPAVAPAPPEDAAPMSRPVQVASPAASTGGQGPARASIAGTLPPDYVAAPKSVTPKPVPPPSATDNLPHIKVNVANTLERPLPPTAIPAPPPRELEEPRLPPRAAEPVIDRTALGPIRIERPSVQGTRAAAH